MSKHQRQKIRSLPPVELAVESMGHDGRGIAHREGKIVFVDGALPGERVKAEITFVHKRYDEAKVLELYEASPDRVTPPCAHYGVCGGCSMQHMAPAAQIAYKQGVLAEQLKHFGGVEPETWLPPLTDPEPAYRRKARLGVKYVLKKESLLVGFREKKASFLADIERCEVLDTRIGASITALRTLIGGLEKFDHIPQIEVAAGDDEVALVFRHMVDLPAGDVAKLSSFCAERSWQLYLQPAGNDSVHRVWPPSQGAENDRLSYALPAFDLNLRFHPMDFTQVNAGINKRMVSLALDLLDPGKDDRVLDLFCGLGNFTLPLARRAGQVVGVEGVDTMVQRGYENARHNGLGNVDFYAQDLTQDFSAQPWASAGFDLVLIDPPRTGALEVVRYLPRFGARRLVYVSCKPDTLARDAGELAKAGYKLMKAGVMDMFTHTAHVESIAVFDRV
jgi:23S rRNA (uracil1939-C5)-methyltransferase